MDNHDSNLGYDDLTRLMREAEEELKKTRRETEARYLQRKQQKEEHRARIEAASMKLCSMIEAAPEPQKPEEITALAAALSHITMAMHAAENYAEYRPLTGCGIGFGV